MTILRTEDVTSPNQDSWPYNLTFENLVSDDEDLTGMVAYALYKQNKRAWIRKFKEQKGRAPEDKDEIAYVDSNTDHDFDRLRDHAQRILLAFGDYMVQSAAPEIREKAITEHILEETRKTLKTIQEQGGGWIRQTFISVIGGFIGAVVWSIFLAIILVVLTNIGSDIWSVIQKAFEVKSRF